MDKNRPYKLLRIYEHLGQDEMMIREGAGKEFLQRVWLIWSSPLSDRLKVQATNTFAMSALSCFMTTTEWTVYEVRELDRLVRKILIDNKRRHPCASVHLMYLSRSMGCRGLKSVQQEYKELKIKTALHLYTSTDQAVKEAAQSDQARRSKRRKSLMKDAEKYAEELGVEICKDSNDKWTIKYTTDTTGEEMVNEMGKIKCLLREARIAVIKKTVTNQPWLGRITNKR